MARDGRRFRPFRQQINERKFMKKIIQLLFALAFAGAAASSGAAPRAAEDPTAVVISTTASAPRVKREIAAEKHSAPQTKKSKSKTSKASGKKKGGKQMATKGKKAR